VRPQDEDRGRFTVAGDPGDMGRMRTPSLRDVGLRTPCFHDGSKRTRFDVVDGGRGGVRRRSSASEAARVVLYAGR
jgi:hypothetical protein